MGLDLAAGIVRILKPDGATAGAGFVVSDRGLVATCAHVARGAGVGPGEAIRLAFQATGDEREALVEPGWTCRIWLPSRQPTCIFFGRKRCTTWQPALVETYFTTFKL